MVSKTRQLRSNLIKQIRKAKGITLENIRDDTKTNISILSEMEQRKRKISDENIIAIMETLGETFVIVEDSEIQKLQNFILKYFKCFYYMNKPDCKSVEDIYFNEFCLNDQKVYDDRYYYLLLLDLFIQIRHQTVFSNSEIQPDFNSKLQTLVMVYKDFPDPFNSIANLLIIQHYTNIRDLDKVANALKEVQLQSCFSKDPMVMTLTSFLELKFVLEKSDVSRAYSLIPTIRNALFKDKNYFRLINLDKLEAVYFMLVGEYEHANQSLCELEMALTSLDVSIQKRSILENRIWCMLMTHQFSGCIDLIDRLEKSFPITSISNTVFKPYCLYRLGPEICQEELLDLLDELSIKFNDNNDTLKMIEIQSDLIRGRIKMFYRNCTRYIRQLIKDHDGQLARFFIQMGLDEFEKRKDYELMYHFHELMKTL